ncbi:hypothetical protein Tco_0258476 [Tanacetum coccineum]
MFDEYLNPPKSVVSTVSIVAAPRPVDPTGTPLSTSIDQDAPFESTSLTQEQLQSPVISEGVEEQLQLAQTEEPNSQESSSNVQSTNPPFELLDKWTKNHPLEYVIVNSFRPVSTRLEPKNYKKALLESSCIDAMQEENHEFEQLEVWELIPRPDYVIII